MTYVKRCLCNHSSHQDETGHPPSMVVAEENIVPVGWAKGAPFEICKPCIQATHHMRETTR